MFTPSAGSGNVTLLLFCSVSMVALSTNAATDFPPCNVVL